MSVVIETTLGDITVDLFVKERPQTCLNFLKLCKLKYYNLNLFHTVNANFCAQTGDPTGKGDGGESIHGLLKGSDFRFYQGEVQPKIRHDSTGLISMVSHGKGMLGSQFIITLSPDLGSLDGEHCVFGKVVEGSEVLLKLNETIADEKHRPYQDIRVTHTVVLDDPFPDPSGMLTPPPSPVPPSTKDAAYSRIPADEALSDSHTQEELTEMVQAREAAARATILEMVGDLPDADVAPPENVLFVCKLNPVTSDHDLSLIFSRFGKVKSCEVIRDAVTGESLQYAFVEFEDKKSCEEAYFKMDNVLIDERRIHVDFSQSVAKWRGKGRGVEMLVPTPAGGWGSKNNQNRNFSKRNEPPRRNRKEAREHYEKKPLVKDHERRKDNGIKNGESRRNKSINKVVEKKEVPKKKRRPSPSSSSSSETTSSSSSSDSSDSEPVKKKSRSRKANKVLVVVKTPRGRRQKKSKKTSKTSRKYDSDSDSDPPKRKKKKTRKRDSSSSSEESVAPKKKKRHSAEKSEKKKRSKKRKPPSSESSSDDSSEEEVQVSKKKAKRRKNDDDSSETESRKKRKKSKNVMKRRRSTSSSDNESDDSDSD